MKVTLLVGIPCSGKSTYCKQFPDATIISFDNKHKELFGKYCMERFKEVIDGCFADFYAALKRGDKHIIIDNTNIRQRDRNAWKRIAVEYHYDVEEEWFHTTLEEALRRNKLRNEQRTVMQVPEHVIVRMFDQLYK